MAVYLTPEMTLEQKLAAIDAALEQAEAQQRAAGIDAPIDPATLVTCDGCE